MKIYLLSLGAGLLVGIIYSLMQVRSPAPPAIALLGLLGMLIGEQVVPVVKQFYSSKPLTVRWFKNECAEKITGVSIENNILDENENKKCQKEN
ncbi:XapX domain-containing protein [Pseudoalteromonas sp. B137]